jgi:hypothetical protein
MNPQPAEGAYFHHNEDGGFAFAGTACSFHKPRYLPGETVYIKETWGLFTVLAGHVKENVVYKSEDPNNDSQRWKSPRFMPAWAARSHARIVSVRPERIQEITGEDCSREGMEEHYFGGYDFAYLGMPPEAANFRRTWESLHPGSWEKNEFVWRIVLEKVKP